MQKDTIINSLVCKLLIEVKQVLVKTLHIHVFEVAIHCKNRLVVLMAIVVTLVALFTWYSKLIV